MKEFIEKLIGRLEEQRGHICNCMPCNGCKYIGDCNEGEFAEDVALDKAIEIVNQLAEEYNNGWILCSERLPNKEEYLKDDGRFIVTDGNRRYQSIFDIYQGGFRTLKLFTNGGSERGWNFEDDNCVIAWQPLPEPFEQIGE